MKILNRYTSIHMKPIRLFILIVLLGIVLGVNAQVNTLHMEQITDKEGLPQNSVQSVKQDKYGFIWFSSFFGLTRYDGYEFEEYDPAPDDSTTIFTKSIYNIMLDEEQNIWIAFFDTTRFCRYNYETNDFTRFNNTNIPPKVKELVDRRKINPTVADQDKHCLWEYDNGILYKIHKVGGHKETYFLDFQQENPINNEHVKITYLDSYGVLWLGTENRGIYKINTLTKPFYSFMYNFDNEGDNQRIIREIYQDEEDLWLGTMYDGVFVFNRRTKKMRHIKEGEGQTSLQDGQIRCLYKDKKGHFWIGTKGGLSEYNPQTNRIRNYNRYGKVNIPHNWVHDVLEDQNGDLWIATFYGIARYDREKDQFIHIDPYKTLVNSRVFCMIVDSENNLWVGTHGGGLTCLKRTEDRDQFEPIHYINEPGNENTLSSNRIFSLLEDENGDIWAATDYGLNEINPKTQKIKRYTKEDGLLDDIVVTVAEDLDHNIWIATKKGLTKLDIQTGEFSHFNEKDGLQTNDFSENAYFLNHDSGEMIFGNSIGTVAFFPSKIKINQIHPKVTLTGLQVLNKDVKPGDIINGRKILTKQMSLTDEIVLDDAHRSFSIEFAALQFANPMSNQYQFMLEGYDEDWVLTTAKRRFATYSNLPSGKYLFKVKASNDDGLWNEEETTLKVTIKPPWWLTIWAFIGYFIVLSAIIYGTLLYILARFQLKNEVRYEKMKARKISELNKQKEEFFTNISHELRTPLSLLLDPLRKLNAGQVDNLSLGYYHSLMYQNAQRLSRLINELLDFKKIELDKFELKSTQDNLVTFLINIGNAFRLTANEREIEYNITSNYPEIIANFDPGVMEKIIFNLLSNAFKYNKDGGKVDFKITIDVDNKQDEYYPVKIVIADNGYGIAKDNLDKIFEAYFQGLKDFKREGTGIGLSLTKELVTLQGGEISAESELNKGTVFTVILPIGMSYNQVQNTTEDALISDEQDWSDESEEEVPAKSTILIVEDDPDVRTYLKTNLSTQYEIIEAEDGVAGWQIATENVPDLLITDLMMPESDGFELCKKVKADKRTSHIPVIILTALSGDQTTLSAFQSGADAYVTKPFSSAILQARIKNLIASRNIIIDSFSKNPFIDIKKMAGNKLDEDLLQNAISCIEEYISEPEFNIDLLADKMGLNRRQLSQKIKTLMGQTVNEFVKTVRLNKAAELLLTTDDTVSEIAYKLGYTAPANFSRSFSKQFGKTPTEYVASLDE